MLSQFTMTNWLETCRARSLPKIVPLFQYFILLVKFFPDTLSDCLFHFVRLGFLFLLGFAALIRRFNDGEFVLLLSLVLATFWYAQKQKYSRNQANE